MKCAPPLLALTLLLPIGRAQQAEGQCLADAQDLGLPVLLPAMTALELEVGALEQDPQGFELQPDTAVRARDLAGVDELHATCYDDGDVCPGGCDSHVVTNRADNGTARVHAPGSQPGDWRACRNGQECEVCFGDDPAGCIPGGSWVRDQGRRSQPIVPALAAVPLDRGLPEGAVVLGVGVLAVVLAAPAGVFSLLRGVPRMLRGMGAA